MGCSALPLHRQLSLSPFGGFQGSVADACLAAPHLSSGTTTGGIVALEVPGGKVGAEQGRPEGLLTLLLCQENLL
jgi:hypothetical protein